MHVFDSSKTPDPIVTPHGETIYEIVGRTVGDPTANHSVAYVIIAPGKSSVRHFHPKAEESFYILKGRAKIDVGDETNFLEAGQIVLIPSPKPHKIYNIASDPLEFLAVCVPAWEPSNTVWLEKNT
jgi:mannose-6-phosphate isomerase-like protein (cupin superfamily)